MAFGSLGIMAVVWGSVFCQRPQAGSWKQERALMPCSSARVRSSTIPRDGRRGVKIVSTPVMSGNEYISTQLMFFRNIISTSFFARIKRACKLVPEERRGKRWKERRRGEKTGGEGVVSGEEVEWQSESAGV